MAKLNRKAAEKWLEEHGVTGIDWSKIDWAKLMQMIMAIITTFKSHPQAQRAVGTASGCSSSEACAAHFAAIQELAACGMECCNGDEEG